MKAWVLHSLEGLKGLKLGELPEPQAKAGEVVLRVLYAALNPADRYLAENQYPAKPPLPHVLGRDAVGEVIAVGSSVTAHRAGDLRVVLRGETGVSRHGTFAERVAVASHSLVAVPDDWRIEEAAGATLVYLTAYQALTQWGKLEPASVVLVTGASGGVGVASIQLGKAMGLRMVGLSRDAGKGEKLKQQGAELVLDPMDAAWREKLYAELGKRPIDLAIDNIGGQLFNDVIDTLRQDGKVSCVGMLAGPVPQFNTASLFFRRIRLGGVAVGTYSRVEAHSAWAACVDLLSRTGARPLVDQVFAFEQLPQAFERLAKGPMGKVLVRVGA